MIALLWDGRATAVRPPEPCESYHARLRQDRRAFAAELIPNGVQHLGGDLPALLLGRCRRCDSTIAVELEPGNDNGAVAL